ncbi:MAG: methionine--tRNA ligase [Verrucomicrobia bacterium]|nr:methionine--tRNA ligase [Verrucomicrobiota bacterium]
MKSFYITTAIDYANGSPHLGHAYEKVLTDVVARFRRAKGDSVYFLTGLDEHGQKVQQSAEKQGVSPQEFCDSVAEEFQALCRNLNISNDDYIRTTEARHKQVVRDFQQSLFDKGEIYKGPYNGFYSARQEQFLQERDRNEDGSWPEIFGEVSEISEENYYFKLSQYQDWLIGYLQENEDFIFPRFRQKQVLEFLKEPLNDLCISRPKSRLAWGISLPFDEDYVTYVWFDALINYLTASGFMEGDTSRWPADYHVIGKDIMVPAHSIYWPIMLKACDIPLPKHLLVHGFWTSSGAKMSKSTGNTVNPLDLADKFGVDSFRYFVTREMNVGQDSDFSEEQFLRRYTSELANDLGNLVSRLQNMVTRYTDGVIPAASIEDDEEKDLKTLWAETSGKVVHLAEGFQFHQALEETFQFIRSINRYVEQRAPWKLAKSEEAGDRALLETSLAVIAEGLRLASIVLGPVMPSTSDKIQRLLGSEPVQTFSDNLVWDFRLEGKSVGEKTILFPRPEK